MGVGGGIICHPHDTLTDLFPSAKIGHSILLYFVTFFDSSPENSRFSFLSVVPFFFLRPFELKQPWASER